MRDNLRIYKDSASPEEKRPDSCIEYDHFCQEYETVATYQAQVAAQGRRPIVAEYEAAQAWVAQAEERRKERERKEAAKAACERLRAPEA